MPDGPIVSLSTCWCSSRHQDGYEMLKEMADLGFTHAELSHGIRMTLVPGILKAFDEGIIKISSTHNFCPLPPGIQVAAPNLYQPSSPNPGERQLWVRYTTQSLEFGQRLGSRLLVCHLGSEFYFFGSPAGKVSALAEQLEPEDLREDPTYKAALTKLMVKLRKNAPKHYERIRESLAAVAPRASSAGIKLGCENREGLLELPLDDDMDALLTNVAQLDVCVGWHDTGHARLKEMEGLISHADYLAKNHAKLFGFHLHDVADGKDHQPLGTGTVDWPMIRQYVRPDQLLVLELSPRLTVEQVKESRAFLDKWLATPPPVPEKIPTQS